MSAAIVHPQKGALGTVHSSGTSADDQWSGLCHGCGKTLTSFEKCLSKHSCVLVDKNVWGALCC